MCLKTLTAASDNPPKWGARSGVIVHCMVWLLQWSANSGLQTNFFILLAASTKFVPFSLQMVAGKPRRAINLRSWLQRRLLWVQWLTIIFITIFRLYNMKGHVQYCGWERWNAIRMLMVKHHNVRSMDKWNTRSMENVMENARVVRIKVQEKVIPECCEDVPLNSVNGEAQVNMWHQGVPQWGNSVKVKVADSGGTAIVMNMLEMVESRSSCNWCGWIWWRCQKAFWCIWMKT